MNTPFYFNLVVNIILETFSFIVGLAVLLRNYKSHTNIVFFILVAAVNIYVIFNFFSLFPGLSGIGDQLFWIRMVMSASSLVGPLIFILSHTFPKQKLSLSPAVVVFLIFLGIISAYASLTPYVFTKLDYVDGMPLPTSGPLIVLYAVDVPLLVFISLVLFWIRYLKSSGEEKTRNFYFLAGLTASFIFSNLAAFVSVSLFKTSKYVFVAPLTFYFLIFFTGYAILKYRFLDIQPIIARAISYLILLVVVAAIYVDILFFAGLIIFKLPLRTEFIALNVVFTLIIALSFQPLQRATRKFTDRIFFKGLYDFEKLLFDLTHIMSNTIDIDELTQKVSQAIVQQMRITKAAFLLVDQHGIADVKGIGYDRRHLMESPFESFIHERSISDIHAFAIHELESGSSKDILRKYDVEVAIPIRVESEEVAILILGTKASGDIYNRRDLRLLDLFASEAGIAIKQARLYTDLKVASEAKSRFINIVSHQLRTPVSSIRWSLEMLRGKKISEADRHTFFATTYQNIVFLGEQLDDILIAFDIYDRKIHLQKMPCDLYILAKEVCNEFSELIRIRKLKIEYDFQENAHAIVADCGKLKKVITVLIKNAILYSPKYEVMKLGLRIEQVGGRNFATVSVGDRGIGITAEEKDHIFEEFFRGDEARLISPNGLGLGMFIAKSFVREHDGKIWFESAGRHKGATFYFSLPA